MEEISPQLKDQLDRIERDAVIALRRGDKKAYREAVEKARELAPDSPQVLGFVGDALAEQGKLDEAMASYKRAVELDPTNTAIETKLAELAIKKAAAATPFDMQSEYESMASAKTATILSVMIPGLGQVVLGRNKEGAIMFGGWAFFIIMSMLIPQGFDGLLAMLGMGRAPFNPLILLTLLGALIFWIWSWGEMSGRAKTMDKKKIERPVPPVDKEF